MPAANLSAEMIPLAQMLPAFQKHFGSLDDVHIARAPGRVNLLGEHTDYNDGFVLPMTIGQAVYLALRARNDDQIVIHALNHNETRSFSLHELPGTGSSWQHYIGGVVDVLQRRGAIPTGFEGVVYGNVPAGAGLSSSAALEVATIIALEDLFGFQLDPVEAALTAQRIEHEYVGVQCGIMDQFTSRLGKQDRVLFLDCRTLAHQSVPFALQEASILIADSRVKRALAGSKYNERRAECAEGVRLLRKYDSEIHALRDVRRELLYAHEAELPENVARRSRHVVEENARVVEGVNALRINDLTRFGGLMNASHDSLRDLYEVSCAELDLLVETARQTEGVYGSRMTGAGFGGCTVTLVRDDALQTLQSRLRHAFEREFHRQPGIYVVRENLQSGVVQMPE